MDKLVIKRLIIQMFIIIILLISSFGLINKVFGASTIKYIVASDPISNTKGIVLIVSVNNGKINNTITSTNGYVLLEKEGYLNPYKVSNNSTILFYGNPLNNDRGIYVLDTDTYKISDISKDIKFPSDPKSFQTVNFSSISSSFCYFFKEERYKVNCYSLDSNTNKVSIVNTDEINKLIFNIKSDKYSLENSSRYFNDTNTNNKDEYVLGYSKDKSEINPINLLSFNIRENKINIKTNNLKAHIYDNENLDNSFPQTNDVVNLNNVTPISLFSTVKIDGMQYTESSTNDEIIKSDCNNSCPNVTNPVIGSQYIEYEGVKYLEWLSTYNFNNITAGIFGNHTIYVKVNDSVYLIDIKSRSVYKVNSNKDFTNTVNTTLLNY